MNQQKEISYWIHEFGLKLRRLFQRLFIYRYKRAAKRHFLKFIEGSNPICWYLPNRPQKAILAALKGSPYLAKGIEGPTKATTITVVIPHFNQAALLKECIQSILAQTRKPEEIIVVDDVSNDIEDVRKALRPFSKDITLIESREKLYSGGARNLGAKLAKGDIISFFDADDIMHPQRLEFIMRAFEEKKDTCFVITGYVVFVGTEVPTPNVCSEDELRRSLIEPNELDDQIAGCYASSRLSWIDPLTKEVPWFAWGSMGIEKMYKPHDGSISIVRGCTDIVEWKGKSDYVFTPYEDYEYTLMMQALTRKGRQIDLPLMFYRRGYNTSRPQEMIR